MGQAKQRGTFEQRKAEAIKVGRVKVRYSKQTLMADVREAFLQLLVSKGLGLRRKNR